MSHIEVPLDNPWRIAARYRQLQGQLADAKAKVLQLEGMIGLVTQGDLSWPESCPALAWFADRKEQLDLIRSLAGALVHYERLVRLHPVPRPNLV